MAKAKAPTPQELYRARKQREEQEKAAYLPPGLVNHGNTCFMNSVLQGLIATRLLDDLVHFNSIPPSVQEHSSTPLLSRRSPLLTNGHGLGGPYEHPWANTMPIGDIFLNVMHKAWQTQALQRRESLSPKPILSTLGRKYDQYLDFAQQDAHEFLRILLDAMRMEELDIIKKRQPPPPASATKRRRRTTITPSHMYPEPEPLPEEDKLVSLPDMIFGGKLTSILVCQKCKHVSQTYEDFNDISLSIKAEDYQERKRDRLKNLAKRLTSFPAVTLAAGSEIPRPSSVPPSPGPRERGTQQLGGHEEGPIGVDPRRRSLDIVADPGQEADSERSTTETKEDIATTESDRSNIFVNGVEAKEDKHVVIAESTKQEKKEKREKKDDGWSKIGRRISMTVGLGKGMKERGSRPRDRNSRELATSANLNVPTTDEGRASADSSRSTPRTSTSEIPSSHPPAILLSRPSTPPPAHGPEAAPTSRSPSPVHFITRSKSPKPPKPSSAELEYLGQILADITPSSASPFALFKPGYHHSNSSNRSVSAGSPPASAHNMWLNMSQFSGIEECLRMFTAVEILDGENMVGCRRCWKIANGEYISKDRDICADDDSDSVDHGSGSSDVQGNGHALSPLTPPTPTFLHLPTSMSTPTVSFYNHSDNDHNAPNRSLSSLPSDGTPLLPDDTKAPEHRPSSLIRAHTTPTPGGMPIPLISTSAPVDPSDPKLPRPLPQITTPAPRPLPIPPTASSSTASTPVAQPTPRLGQVLSHLPPSASPAASKDSLPIPKPRRQPVRPDDSTDDSSGSGAESENSVATSARSVDSSSTSVGMDHSHLQPQSQQQQPPQAKKPSRPKPVIMRPAYKRYLIGTPPPVLVIHLKRFQQISKTHMLSFSHGFRKLDDYVTFPELLDLTPYLAPKKEDFGLGKKAKHAKRKTKDGEKCMYRLYAVVVHIGNMLGGHYIAYTALPTPSSPVEGGSSSSIEKSDPPPSSAGSGHSNTSSMPPSRPWAYISDTIVRLTTLEEVLKAKAYMCMYERI